MRAPCPAHSGAREGPGAVGAMPGAGEGQGAGYGVEPPGSRTPRTPSAPPPLQPARKGKRNRGTASFSEAPPPHRATQDTQRPLPGTGVTLQRAGTRVSQHPALPQHPKPPFSTPNLLFSPQCRPRTRWARGTAAPRWHHAGFWDEASGAVPSPACRASCGACRAGCRPSRAAKLPVNSQHLPVHSPASAEEEAAARAGRHGLITGTGLIPRTTPSAASPPQDKGCS